MKKSLTRVEKENLLTKLMWDYQIPGKDVLDLLEGNRETAGPYTAETIFRKLLESYSWYTILAILGPERVLQLLTDRTIASLRYKSLSQRYEFIRTRLQKALHTPG
jgi:hypothetical protein